jgi:hypothetical protein
MRWPRCLCLGLSPRASSEDELELKKCLREVSKCKKTRRLLQRDLRAVRRLHLKNAHLEDVGGQGQSLEIDLVSRIRAADVRIIQYEVRIQRLKQKRRRGDIPSEQINSPLAGRRSDGGVVGGGAGDQDILQARARVVQELQMLFGAQIFAPLAARNTDTVRAFKMYYAPFKYM